MLSKQSYADLTTPTNGDTIVSYVFGTNRVASAAVAGNESLYTISALSEGAGTALTSTLVSGKQSLDVNVTAFDGTAVLNIDGNVADDAVDSGDPVKVGTRATQAFPTAVASGDRADMLSDVQRRLRVTNAPNIAAKVSRAAVGLTAAALVTPQAGRQKFVFQNRGNKKVWIGFDASVTADDAATGGIVIDAHNGTWAGELGDNVSLFGISDTAGQFLFVYEAA